MSRFLITTALEDTWRDHEPVLFLGEWCRRYSRRGRWLALDAEVLPYHWDDRKKLYADYRYLNDVYERLLQDLTVQLNQIHGVAHSLRYWRILLGPWLGHFVPMVFDRWTSIQQAVSQYDLSATIVLTDQDNALVPNDMKDFGGLLEGDAWNHHVYAAVLEQCTDVTCIGQARRTAAEIRTAGPALTKKQQLKLALASRYSKTAGLLTRDRDAFLLETYLPFQDEIRLHWRLGQVPQLWQRVSPVRVAVDTAWRQWAVRGEARSGYESCIRALIPQHIPAVYLEGYGRLMEQIAGLPWPSRPRVIWTSNAENSNDVFKAWAAEKVERGSPLIIGQHGGHFGVGRWLFLEDHQLAISDRWLSWGWSDAEQPKVTPVGQLKAKRPLGIRHAVEPGALLVTCTLPRQSYFMYSVMVSRQWLDYFADQCAFVEHLPPSIRRALTVRLFAQDLGWDQTARWRDRFPDLRLDEGRSSIDDLIRHSRIFIATYNAATYLESFTMNVPTVIYWNPDHWELRDSAVPYFDDLKRVGIFHETPEAAARHVALVWDDIDAWWESPAVREVLDRFKGRYCDLRDDLLSRLETVLNEEVKTRGSVPRDCREQTT